MGLCSPTKDQTHTSALEVQSLNHWNAREFLRILMFKRKNRKKLSIETVHRQILIVRLLLRGLLVLCCAALSSSVVSNSLQSHGLQATRLLCPWGFSRQEYWSGLPCPPPGDLPNPGIGPRSLALQMDSLPSEPPGKPKNRVAYPFSRGSSWPRNRTRVSCTAGGFFISWGTREAHLLHLPKASKIDKTQYCWGCQNEVDVYIISSINYFCLSEEQSSNI